MADRDSLYALLQLTKQAWVTGLQGLPQCHFLIGALGAACVDPAMNAAIVFFSGRNAGGKVAGELKGEAWIPEQQPRGKVGGGERQIRGAGWQILFAVEEALPLGFDARIGLAGIAQRLGSLFGRSPTEMEPGCQ